MKDEQRERERERCGRGENVARACGFARLRSIILLLYLPCLRRERGGGWRERGEERLDSPGTLLFAARNFSRAIMIVGTRFP